MRISDWSSDVCSSDLCCPLPSWRSAFLGRCDAGDRPCRIGRLAECREPVAGHDDWLCCRGGGAGRLADGGSSLPHAAASTPCRYCLRHRLYSPRSEEHTPELQSLMRSSYAVFCLTTK